MGADGSDVAGASRPSKRLDMGPRYGMLGAAVVGGGAGTSSPAAAVGASVSVTYSCAVPRPGLDAGSRRTVTCVARGIEKLSSLYSSSVSALYTHRSKSVPLPILFCNKISRFNSHTLMPVPSNVSLCGSRCDRNL